MIEGIDAEAFFSAVPKITDESVVPAGRQAGDGSMKGKAQERRRDAKDTGGKRRDGKGNAYLRLYINPEDRAELDSMHMAYKVATGTRITLNRFVMAAVRAGLPRLSKEAKSIFDGISKQSQ